MYTAHFLCSSASYASSSSAHDLVGAPEYSHFTSPLRRVSDCVCHCLLKYVRLVLRESGEMSVFGVSSGVLRAPPAAPFSAASLSVVSLSSSCASRCDRKTQYLDAKFRLLQAMDAMLCEGARVDIEYCVVGYSGLFLNLLIVSVGRFRVHASYTLRVRGYAKGGYAKGVSPEERHSLRVTRVRCFAGFDEGTLPELDARVLGKC